MADADLDQKGLAEKTGVGTSTIRKIMRLKEENYNSSTLSSLSTGIRRPSSYLSDKLNGSTSQESDPPPQSPLLEWIKDIQRRLRQALDELDDMKRYLPHDTIHGSIVPVENSEPHEGDADGEEAEEQATGE
jgi:transcriptional regulator with XRE-family HTH domain